jgi:hypothetical protein
MEKVTGVSYGFHIFMAILFGALGIICMLFGSISIILGLFFLGFAVYYIIEIMLHLLLLIMKLIFHLQLLVVFFGLQLQNPQVFGANVIVNGLHFMKIIN